MLILDNITSVLVPENAKIKYCDTILFSFLLFCLRLYKPLPFDLTHTPTILNLIFSFPVKPPPHVAPTVSLSLPDLHIWMIPFQGKYDLIPT